MKVHLTNLLFKDADDSARPIRSITILQPLPTIDPKDKEASKAALARMYNEVQAQIDVDHELAARLTHEEQEMYTVEERSKFLAGFFDRRKKHLAKEQVEAIRSKPPIKTQLRNLMMTYLKHRGSEEDEKRVGSRKKRVASSSSKQKSPKKQKSNDQESIDSDTELRKCLKVVPNDDKAIDYETLDVKTLIVDYESQVQGTIDAASRPDIMFAVCTCSKFQVTPKLSHLHVVKRIFRKSTTEGCQFLGRRLISWQCKKQTIVATSITKAEYVVAANCYAQTESNVEFHQIVDFLTSSSIYHALTVSPTIYASNIEQF
uniref:Uncharacterized protein n=1 Tax=Tanacetum cinerariifolium TaxID=118510 RepID=A0A6L2LWC8_TANCI|nr:hypothetical protein [Tanacetum cinerariifolium]